MLVAILLIAVLAFALAYAVYGRFLAHRYELDDTRPTPSHTDYDGIDRVPAHKAVLLGHHFSSIAGAAPIVGPIIASLAFGWLPVVLWIILGTIFIGAVIDFSALVASIRHNARSIAEIARQHMSPVAYRLLLAFIWLTLVYVLTVFADLTATTFTDDGGVATSSLMFIALAVVFGLAVNKMKIPLLWASLVFVPLVFLVVWAGQKMPLSANLIPEIITGEPKKTWALILILYCFLASTTPVWILLQPRDYLSSYLLYASVLSGFVGILIGGFTIQYPAFTAWSVPPTGTLFPILFITVACGACSGFHSIVASGTSSKQLNKESDGKAIGYGGMLLEGLVAVIALATVIMLPKDDQLTLKAPLVIYGRGIANFLSAIGIPENLGFSFGLLALSAFILTTLDTATRLGRYIFEELFNLKGKSSRYVSTFATLTLPAIFVLINLKDARGNLIPAWKAIWPVFGACNQLLAGLVALVIAVWLKKTGRRFGFILGPVLFMNTVTVWALVLLLRNYRFSAVGIIAAVLLLLALVLIVEAFRTFKKIIIA
ncbi:MAG: carbon starvation protein A [Phycisphaerae bacterium]|nr:carbon starvation protein A [Phycisphaerae bacterium]NIP51663.1 carbon starvation protein A [Phycisphaerae bacterium]NIS50773.1 carbon starvation protein A [Phycisphaerae bacterium]NIU08524.1 carbon starvation protein A [Phycisphaerae bacterium]NIU57806.1 carbon starvation protein A [Phycisphaerae bacterium]